MKYLVPVFSKITIMCMFCVSVPPAPLSPVSNVGLRGRRAKTQNFSASKRERLFRKAESISFAPNIGVGGSGGGTKSRPSKQAVSATDTVSVIFENTGIGYWILHFQVFSFTRKWKCFSFVSGSAPVCRPPSVFSPLPAPCPWRRTARRRRRRRSHHI